MEEILRRHKNQRGKRSIQSFLFPGPRATINQLEHDWFHRVNVTINSAISHSCNVFITSNFTMKGDVLHINYQIKKKWH